MKKSELRKIIREETQKELYRILPDLLREAVSSVLTKQARKPARKVAGGKRPVAPMDRQRMAELIGYGDMTPRGEAASTPRTVAGVPMNEGLRAREAAAGVAHFRDYDAAADQTPSDFSPEYSSMPALPGGVDGGAAVPVALVQALGARGKKILDEANARANWRPGMRRR